MPDYRKLPAQQLKEALAQDRLKYETFKKLGLKLDMSRGKPDADQLDLSTGLNETVGAKAGFLSEAGTDARNYGLPDGLPEIRRLFAEILEVRPEEVIAGGNSSLNLMFDTVSYCCTHGVPGGEPWCRTPAVRFLCPSPGYDRHFAVSEFFGFELVPVRMTPDGPDMDEIRALVEDESVKGMWSVPRYSNPTGVTYSDDTVCALAQMKTAAPDFRIFWDDAYCVHDLYEQGDRLLPLLACCREAGNPDRALIFASTSKITYAGAGVAAMAASKANIAWLKKPLTARTIGPDKLNQLRHARFLPDLNAVRAQMRRHAALLRPKFELVLGTLEQALAGTGIAQWSKPNGGYFISVDVFPGTAARVVALCKEAGVVLTPAGATWPYGRDPLDRNIRLAPTFPPLSELDPAIGVFCVCARIAAAEKLLSGRTAAVS